jgi:hypothetical protein
MFKIVWQKTDKMKIVKSQYTVPSFFNYDLNNYYKKIPIIWINYYLQLNVAHKLKSRLKLEHCPTFSETVELSFATGPKSLQKHADLFRYE